MGRNFLHASVRDKGQLWYGLHVSLCATNLVRAQKCRVVIYCVCPLPFAVYPIQLTPSMPQVQICFRTKNFCLLSLSCSGVAVQTSIVIPVRLMHHFLSFLAKLKPRSLYILCILMTVECMVEPKLNQGISVLSFLFEQVVNSPIQPGSLKTYGKICGQPNE